MKKKKTEFIAFRTDEDIKNYLNEQAEKNDLSISHIINRILKEKIEYSKELNKAIEIDLKDDNTNPTTYNITAHAIDTIEYYARKLNCTEDEALSTLLTYLAITDNIEKFFSEIKVNKNYFFVQTPMGVIFFAHIDPTNAYISHSIPKVSHCVVFL